MHTRCGSSCAVSSNDSSTPTPRRSEESQERRLRALVRVVAARSPFYREYFRESGVDPRSIRTLEDLPQLPLLTRDHLLERVDDFRVYPRRLMWTARLERNVGPPDRCLSDTRFVCLRTVRAGTTVGLVRPSAWRASSHMRGSDFAATEPGKLTKAIPGAQQLLVSSFHLIPSNLDAIMHDVRAFDPTRSKVGPRASHCSPHCCASVTRSFLSRRSSPRQRR